MKQLCCLFFLVAVFSSYSFGQKFQEQYPGKVDTLFDNNSGIKVIAMNKNTVAALTNLGMLWGFLKYYHPNVRRGMYNMDAELFRILPELLTATDVQLMNEKMEMWTDHLGPVTRGNASTSNDSNVSVSLQPDYGNLFKPNNFPPTFISKLECIRNSTAKKETPYYVRVGNSAWFPNEKKYSDSFPDAGTRLLALYRYWNIIQYFYPYRHRITGGWNEVLSEFIPVFCEANDTQSYVLACQQLVARIHDGHSGISGGIAHEYYKGVFTIPITAMFIDNKLVVVDAYDTLGIKSSLQPGDIIEEVDGLTIKEHIHKNERFCASSNYSSMLRSLSGWGGNIFATKDTSITLKITRGIEQMKYTFRRMPFSKNILPKRLFASDTAFRIINNDIGYIYPAKLANVKFGAVVKALNNTKGIIIDLRCYPTSFMPYTYGKWLKCNKSEFAKFSQANIDIPGQFLLTKADQNGASDGTDCYKGAVVIIVNAQTISQAEYTAMALASIPGAIVIGDTTAGADGDVSDIVFPGNIHSYMSGLGVLYPDGTDTQNIGIKIDQYIRPTLNGVLSGDDELLDSAIAIIQRR